MSAAVPAALTLEQLIQLYAPLAGLLVLAFWSGVLSQRVKVGESRQTKTDVEIAALDTKLNDAMEATATRIAAAAGDKVEHGRVLERLDNMGRTMERVERDMTGLQRAIANITSGSLKNINHFGQEQ